MPSIDAANGTSPARLEHVHDGPWTFLAYSHATDHPDFALLRAFVHVLVRRFDIEDRVPSCWEQHEAIIEEFGELYRLYLWRHEAPPPRDDDDDGHTPREAIIGETVAPTSFAGQLAETLARIQTTWHGGDCGTGHHERQYSRWAKPEARLGEALDREQEEPPLHELIRRIAREQGIAFGDGETNDQEEEDERT